MCLKWSIFPSSSIRPAGVVVIVACMCGIVTSASPFGSNIKLNISSPRMRHTRGRWIGSIVYKSEVLILCYRLLQLPQYIIVNVSGIAAAFEKRSGVCKTAHAILSWYKISTNRQKNCVRVGVRFHIRLIRQPVVDSKRNLQCFRAIFFIL